MRETAPTVFGGGQSASAVRASSARGAESRATISSGGGNRQGRH
jgi:hypothetical protein